MKRSSDFTTALVMVLGHGLHAQACFAVAESGPSPPLAGNMDLSGSAAAPQPDSPSQAEDSPQPKNGPEPVITLDPVIVTPTRSPSPSFQTPFTTDALDSDRIADELIRSTPEAMRRLPSVMVQKTSQGQGSPFIRGFTGFRNLFLIDGIRLNNSVFREGPSQYWNTVDSFTIDRLEIVKGPSSVLYGSDAIGGTVNAITKRPNSYGPGPQYSGRGYYRVSSAENSHTGRGELSASLDQTFGMFAGFSAKHYGDLIAGEDVGRQPNTGYDETDGDFKFEYFFDPHTQLVIAHQRLQQNNVPRTHATVFSRSFEGTTVGTDLRRDLDQDRDLTYLKLLADDVGSFIDSIRASLSWHHQQETEDRIRGNGRQSPQSVDVGTIGLGLELHSPCPVGELTYGLEYYRDRVNSWSSTNPIQGPVADEASYDLLGLFVQDQIDVTSRLRLILGGRFTYVGADADQIDDPQSSAVLSLSEAWTDLSGSARLQYELVAEHLNIFTGVSRGFRAPNLSDLTRFDTARSGEIEIPSPGLDPEHFLSYEVGLKGQEEWWSAEISYYFTDIQGMIIRKPTGNGIPPNIEVVKLNEGDGFVQGAEVDATIRPHPQWTILGNFTWMDGQLDGFPTSASQKQVEPLSRLMPITVNLAVRYDFPSKPRWWAQIDATFADAQRRLSSSDRRDTERIPPDGTPGYIVFSVRGGVWVNDQLNLTAAMENLADEDYRIHGSGSNEPGRNFILGLDFYF